MSSGPEVERALPRPSPRARQATRRTRRKRLWVRRRPTTESAPILTNETRKGYAASRERIDRPVGVAPSPSGSGRHRTQRRPLAPCGAFGEERSVERCRLPQESRGGVALPNASAAPRPHLRPPRSFTEQGAGRPGETFGLARGDEEPRPFVHEKLGNPPHLRRDGRPSAGHRLHEREGKPLAVGGEDDEVGGGVDPREGAPPSAPVDARLQPEAGREAVERLALGSIA